MTRNLSQFPYEPRDFFVVRTPLLPVDEILSWGASLESPSAPDDVLHEALIRDHVRLTERLRAAVARPEVREAIYLASPDLFERLHVWERDANGIRDGGRISRALIRYFTRMASRPTPFGLFAGVGVGTVGRETRLDVPTGAMRRHVHLDMAYVEALMMQLQQDPAVRAKLRFQGNTSISRKAGRLHYVETHHQKSGRVYTLAAVDATPEVCAILDRCSRPASIRELATALVADDVDLEEAESFVTEMIDAQLLVSDLEPAVTGDRSLGELSSVIAAVDMGTARVLSDVAAVLCDIENAPLGVDTDAYARARAQLMALLQPDVSLRDVFQVDSHLAVDVALGAPIVEEFARAAECLFRLGTSEARPLDGFVKAFVERYDMQEVPLLEALDEEIGVGLPPAPTDPARERAYAAQQLAMTRLLTAALADGATTIELSDADVEGIRYRGPMAGHPPGFAVVGAVAATDAAALHQGRFRIVLEGAAGPSGGALFGRFCHNDATLASAVERQLAAEDASNPEAIHAEVVHLPEGRLGNVLARPVLRRYEIPFLGRGGAPVDQQLRLDDLVVTIRDGRIVLRSRRLDREVIPHLTTSHNADLPSSPRIYRFLGRFERQHNRYALGWPWGALADLPFLPRIIYGRTVLARAQWLVKARELAPMIDAHGAERLRAVRRWRARANLPRFVQLREEDHTLFVDFDNPMCVEVLLDQARNRSSVTLVELLPTPSDTAVSSADGRFLHEIAMPFAHRPAESARPRRVERATAISQPCSVIRRFSPGSEWLFAKLYSGVGVQDRVIRDLIAPVAERAVACGAADLWFFVRYADPHPHIRLRLLGDPRRLASDVLPLLNAELAPFLHDGRIWRLQLDTYEREVERYGGPAGVELAERLFAVDSEAALAILRAVPGAAHDEDRALLGVLSIDRLYADFGFNVAERAGLLAPAVPQEPEFLQQQGQMYRRMRAPLESLIAGADSPGLAAGLAALARRSEKLTPIAASLRAGVGSGAIESTMEQLLLSYTHMAVNRLEAHEPNRAEARYRDTLRRLHVSRLARAGKSVPIRRARDEMGVSRPY